jgi:hypothetical protein
MTRVSSGSMSAQKPASRPKATRDQIVRILADHRITDKVAVVAVRGYYQKSIGDPERNDVGHYDDAVFVVGPTLFAAYNANTDPSNNAKVGRATLAIGQWRYRPGVHGITWKKPKVPYKAFVQAGPVRVHRWGKGPELGWFGINIHRGGASTTGSEGCQTIPPDQWESFRAVLESELKRHGQTAFTYLLVDNMHRF